MENINKIKEGSNTILFVSSSDLKEFGEQLIKEAVSSFTHKEETYLSIAQVTKKLGVNRTTLWRWEKQGYLPTINLGGKVRYKLSDIERILGGK